MLLKLPINVATAAMMRPCALRGRLVNAVTGEHRSAGIGWKRFLSMSGGKTWREEHLAAPQGGAAIPDNVSVRQRRIIYRSKQRGWLELDILMGGWAAKNVPNMHDDGLMAQIEHLLDADTPDVLKWVLGQETPPAPYQTEVMESLQAYANGDGHVNDR